MHQLLRQQFCMNYFYFLLSLALHLSPGKMISLTTFISTRLADLKDFKKVNEIYAKCEFYVSLKLFTFLLKACNTAIDCLSATMISITVLNFHTSLLTLLNNIIGCPYKIAEYEKSIKESAECATYQCEFHLYIILCCKS